jgi:hypothetical protein
MIRLAIVSLSVTFIELPRSRIGVPINIGIITALTMGLRFEWL